MANAAMRKKKKRLVTRLMQDSFVKKLLAILLKTEDSQITEDQSQMLRSLKMNYLESKTECNSRNYISLI